MNAAQCLKGRTLLGWSLEDLAAVSETSAAMVMCVEAGMPGLNPHKVKRIRDALAKAGILPVDEDFIVLTNDYPLPAPTLHGERKALSVALQKRSGIDLFDGGEFHMPTLGELIAKLESIARGHGDNSEVTEDLQRLMSLVGTVC